MKLIFPLALLLISLSAAAARFQSKIDSIDLGSGNIPHLIKLENGHVVFLDGKDKEQLPSFEEGLKSQETLEIEVDESHSLISAQTVETPDSFSPERNRPLAYEPSVVTLREATTAFGQMRRDYQRRSQCYNRAHVWAYEEYQRTGLKSMKLFLFFTSRYIRNYRYGWWFHVSPMTLVSENGVSVERVLDRAFTSGPRYVKNWTDNFIYSRRTCPTVYRYSDYRDHQEEEDCYLIPVSMYFWQPRDIANNVNKTQFYRSEVDYAYWEAF